MSEGIVNRRQQELIRPVIGQAKLAAASIAAAANTLSLSLLH